MTGSGGRATRSEKQVEDAAGICLTNEIRWLKTATAAITPFGRRCRFRRSLDGWMDEDGRKILSKRDD